MWVSHLTTAPLAQSWQGISHGQQGELFTQQRLPRSEGAMPGEAELRPGWTCRITSPVLPSCPGLRGPAATTVLSKTACIQRLGQRPRSTNTGWRREVTGPRGSRSALGPGSPIGRQAGLHREVRTSPTIVLSLGRPRLGGGGPGRHLLHQRPAEGMQCAGEAQHGHSGHISPDRTEAQHGSPAPPLSAAFPSSSGPHLPQDLCTGRMFSLRPFTPQLAQSRHSGLGSEATHSSHVHLPTPHCRADTAAPCSFPASSLGLPPFPSKATSASELFTTTP